MTGLATILGATGFVGRRLQARLTAEGWDVYAPAKGDKSLFGRDMGVVFYCAGLTADYDLRPFDTVEAHATLVSELIQAGRVTIDAGRREIRVGDEIRAIVTE